MATQSHLAATFAFPTLKERLCSSVFGFAVELTFVT